jgi:hypothetical protein
MMKEGVIITQISINRQGERKHFQIKLPKDTKFIIGVEYGGRLISELGQLNIKPASTGNEKPKTLFKRNQLVGELKLQSCEEANWFYATDVFVSDANLGYGDFSRAGFSINDFTHGNKRSEEVVKIDAKSTIIQGWYLDVIGKTNGANINYEITIYVWINTEE